LRGPPYPAVLARRRGVNHLFCPGLSRNRKQPFVERIKIFGTGGGQDSADSAKVKALRIKQGVVYEGYTNMVNAGC
jgi:hypothetical protein